MKLFNRKKRQHKPNMINKAQENTENIPVTHMYSEFDRVPTDDRIPDYILDDFICAEDNDRNIFQQVKDFDIHNADMVRPYVRSLYNRARNDGLNQNTDKKMSLYSIHMTNKGALIEAEGVKALNQARIKRLKEELAVYEEMRLQTAYIPVGKDKIKTSL